MPTASQPHSHRKYIIAIIIVALIGLIVGGLVTSTFLIGPDVTDVTGTVTLQQLYATQYNGIPNRLVFNSAVTGNLSAGVFQDKSYQVYLPILSSGSYIVTIQWTNVTAGAVHSTPARPIRARSAHPTRTLPRTSHVRLVLARLASSPTS